MRKLLLLLTVSLFITQTAFAGKNHCTENNFENMNKAVRAHVDERDDLNQMSYRISNHMDTVALVSDDYTPSELGKLLATQNILIKYGVDMGKNILVDNLNAIDQSLDQLYKLDSKFLKREDEWGILAASCYEFGEYENYKRARSRIKTTSFDRSGVHITISVYKEVREALMKEFKFYQEADKALKAYKAGCAYKEQN